MVPRIEFGKAWKSSPETPQSLEKDFEMEELDHVLKKGKNNKSPGGDGIPIEFFKWLTVEALEYIITILNQYWNNEITPNEMETTEVVTLFQFLARYALCTLPSMMDISCNTQ